MEKLEQYLDRICRHIGGSRSMRQHVRQELREHLLDAVAEHRAAGMSETEALDRAIEEFGQSEEVRTELEAAHGQRMMAVVIDKALDWKEKTMRAKWLWTSWAFLALAVTIALEVVFITFMVLLIVPKFQKLMQDGIVDPAILEEQSVAWIPTFLNKVQFVTNHYTTWIALGAIVLWGLFEWRVKSEHKAFIRLAIFGMIAVALMKIIILQAGSMLVSFCLAAPPMSRMAKPFAQQQVAAIETAMTTIEQAKPNKDWDVLEVQATLAAMALNRLSIGPALNSLTDNNPLSLDKLRSALRAAGRDIVPVQQAIKEKNEAQLEATWPIFRQSWEPIREAAKRAGK